VNGIHDLAGMHGFGSIEREENEPVFHAEWERRIFAIALATMGSRYYNTDELRRSIERMPPARYLDASYYERWLYAIETILEEKKLLSSDEIAARIQGLLAGREAQGTTIRPGAVHQSGVVARQSQERFERRLSEARQSSRFKAGDRIIARNLTPEGHTRLPGYVRGRRGVVHRDWGVFAFPDTHAHGLGANPQHCYAIEFSGRELWGDCFTAPKYIYLDLWEDYLAPAAEAEE
jgi:nitrile hydratase subunit beta